ncbi:uncharacterized protein CELE_Y51H7C.8 [Caenorhabditis elegans]|uniref:Uncharacterized protein n=1 Tax=Caenorhabditis elegans TaxID=6239 RepID=Q9N3J5_CAEEL|nr:Uncharacterized protein CELE_Y51H7C.8 [Caenorhabditis elegans]CCD71794.1 Uncharacterized protein CELE_Y51H7C.8 [Caenorhabditis elegans]|eukprot:NP_493964.1 Uncharacterized protein CELE_Y51H7C.8 [Caenorhabditis elegans]
MSLLVQYDELLGLCDGQIQRKLNNIVLCSIGKMNEKMGLRRRVMVQSVVEKVIKYENGGHEQMDEEQMELKF